MRHTRALALLAGVAALVGYSATARSSDHADSPAAAAAENGTADINDVYAWMSDATHVTLVMTLGRDLPVGTQFSTNVRYVFHTASAATFGAALPSTGATDIIATFDANQNISLWVVPANAAPSDYVTGNPNNTAGLVSADQKVKVFAALRADPFFFNFAGFGNAVTAVEQAQAAGLPTNDAGCPTIDAGTSNALATLLRTSTLDGGAPTNPFTTWNALGIVVQIDKSLLTTATQPLLTVWGGTYRAQ